MEMMKLLTQKSAVYSFFALKLSWAACHVRWLKANKTNISRTISVLVLKEILETLLSSAFNHLTRLAVRESFIAFNQCQLQIIPSLHDTKAVVK
jgi:hypothetical protein